jgi:hypothetical protein
MDKTRRDEALCLVSCRPITGALIAEEEVLASTSHPCLGAVPRRSGMRSTSTDPPCRGELGQRVQDPTPKRKKQRPNQQKKTKTNDRDLVQPLAPLPSVQGTASSVSPSAHAANDQRFFRPRAPLTRPTRASFCRSTRNDGACWQSNLVFNTTPAPSVVLFLLASEPYLCPGCTRFLPECLHTVRVYFTRWI